MYNEATSRQTERHRPLLAPAAGIIKQLLAIIEILAARRSEHSGFPETARPNNKDFFQAFVDICAASATVRRGDSADNLREEKSATRSRERAGEINMYISASERRVRTNSERGGHISVASGWRCDSSQFLIFKRHGFKGPAPSRSDSIN